MANLAGRLRHRVTIQRATITRGAMGGEVESWGTFATVWAQVEPIGGREYLAADEHAGETTYRLTIRYLPGVQQTHRVLWGDLTLEIRQVLNQGGRDRFQTLICTERDAA